ncbi:hypothetical protein [Neptuniibacter sp. QD37_11]|uniref:hypothetical protein n=1 Tax=Neptuniibacter sp. QD37_11 TaxID=3398209 RepID=UPI0039F4D787
MVNTDIYGGFQVNIKGIVTKQDILRIIAEELTELEERFGIEDFSAVNLYTTMYKQGRRTALVEEDDPCRQYLKKTINHKTNRRPLPPEKEGVTPQFNLNTIGKGIDVRKEQWANPIKHHPSIIAVPKTKVTSLKKEIIERRKQERARNEQERQERLAEENRIREMESRRTNPH